MNYKYILIVVLILSFLNLKSQTNIIKGKVIAKNTSIPIAFANVLIEFNNKIVKRSMSDIEGDFLIDSVPKGIYTFYASFIGYYPQKIDNFSIGINEKIKIQNFELIINPIPIADEILYNYKVKIKKSKNNILKGKIIDEKTLEKLPFSRIVIKDSNIVIRNGETNNQGEFIIDSIPTGIFNIIVYNLNYFKQQINNFQFKQNDTIFQEFKLKYIQRELR